MNKKLVSGFVPAKGSSTRVPKKNIRSLAGLPLFLWAAGNLSRVLPKSQIFVHSDDDQILEIAKRYGYQALKRPDSLSNNLATGDDLMKWESLQTDAEVIIQHLPPMPFLKERTLLQAMDAILVEKFDSAFGTYQSNDYTWAEGVPNYDSSRLPNSTELPIVTHEGMGIYATTRASLHETGRRTGGKHKMISLDHFERIDIDYPEQFEIANFVASSLGDLSNYLPPSHARSKLPALTDSPSCVFMDVDGVQTTGQIGLNGETASRQFNSKDGQGIKDMLASGIDVVFVTAANAKGSITNRAEMLGVSEVITCTHDSKFDACNTYLKARQLEWADAWYIGDDHPDVGPMLAAALSVAPSDAHSSAIQAADIISPQMGGYGAVRDLADLALRRRAN